NPTTAQVGIPLAVAIAPYETPTNPAAATTVRMSRTGPRPSVLPADLMFDIVNAGARVRQPEQTDWYAERGGAGDRRPPAAGDRGRPARGTGARGTEPERGGRAGGWGQVAPLPARGGHRQSQHRDALGARRRPRRAVQPTRRPAGGPCPGGAGRRPA